MCTHILSSRIAEFLENGEHGTIGLVTIVLKITVSKFQLQLLYLKLLLENFLFLGLLSTLLVWKQT